MISLSTLTILPILGAIALLALVAVGLQNMVNARQRVRREYEKRASAKRLAAESKLKLMPKLRPLALKRISLSRANGELTVHHRRGLQIHYPPRVLEGTRPLGDRR